MKKEYLLSIVIPTKNRYPYLFKLLKLIDSFHFDNVEVVVQDNNENNEQILEYFKMLGGKPPYISYDWHKESLSVSLNSDYAIINSHGEYVCFIGDDDGFCPQIIDAVKYMKENGVDVLLSSPTFYNWPDYYDPSIFKLYSSIQFVKGSGKLYKINPLQELEKCINNGFDGLYKMPHAYQSLVSRTIMNKLYSMYGTYFPGPSPDMANAVALSLLEPVTYYFDGPIVVSGQSRSVGGGERLLKNNKLKRIEDVPHLPKDIHKCWNPKLPTYWCADTIWPQSGIMCLNNKYLDKVNYELIMSRFIFYHRSYYPECKPLLDNKIKFFFYFMKFVLKKITVFAYHRLSYFFSKRKRLGMSHIVCNISNMESAVVYLSKYSFNK